jgi:hypothetical protein
MAIDVWWTELDGWLLDFNRSSAPRVVRSCQAIAGKAQASVDVCLVTVYLV